MASMLFRLYNTNAMSHISGICYLFGVFNIDSQCSVRGVPLIHYMRHVYTLIHDFLFCFVYHAVELKCSNPHLHISGICYLLGVFNSVCHYSVHGFPPRVWENVLPGIFICMYIYIYTHTHTHTHTHIHTHIYTHKHTHTHA